MKTITMDVDEYLDDLRKARSEGSQALAILVEQLNKFFEIWRGGHGNYEDCQRALIPISNTLMQLRKLELEDSMGESK